MHWRDRVAKIRFGVEIKIRFELLLAGCKPNLNLDPEVIHYVFSLPITTPISSTTIFSLTNKL